MSNVQEASTIAGVAIPSPSAAVVVVRQTEGGLEVFWVKRADTLRFAGGFFVFPGGRVDEEDSDLLRCLTGSAGTARDFDPGHVGEPRLLRDAWSDQAVGRATDEQPDPAPPTGGEAALSSFHVAAARELFEEAGLLLVRGVETSNGALLDWRRDVLEGRRRFSDVFSKLEGELNFEDFLAAGRWTTPDYVPVRFETQFFVVEAPAGQVAEVWEGELVEGAWIRPSDALGRWERGEALLHPPALCLMRTLARAADLAGVRRELAHLTATAGRVDERIEVQRGILFTPLRTPTLPPATHTNCYVLGTGACLLVDPGAHDEAEVERLMALLDDLEKEGLRPIAVALTHHHSDHIGGLAQIVERTGLPVWCHRLTAERLDVPVARLLEDGEVVALGGPWPMRWRVLHTPGHAQGHLVFLEERTRAAVVGDMVASVGTIVIDRADGDMAEYLRQLHRLIGENVGALYPAHGAPIPNGPAKLEAYLAHRKWREQKFVDALQSLAQPVDFEALVASAYDDIDPQALDLARLSGESILDKLEREGRIVRDGDSYRVVS
jgi:glyoxylase-like metal-dependent hydrolase (beta-lactamase superfamily II)/8-oxo-dGTP pyrophosphatase MutT (NUDIX family)